MPTYVRSGGAWKAVKTAYVRADDQWRRVGQLHARRAELWDAAGLIPVLPPVFGNVVAANSGNYSNHTVSWTPNPSGGIPASWKLTRRRHDGTGAVVETEPEITLPASTTSMAFAVTQNTRYSYTLIAVDKQGGVSSAVQYKIKVGAPPVSHTIYTNKWVDQTGSTYTRMDVDWEATNGGIANNGYASGTSFANAIDGSLNTQWVYSSTNGGSVTLWTPHAYYGTAPNGANEFLGGNNSNFGTPGRVGLPFDTSGTMPCIHLKPQINQRLRLRALRVQWSAAIGATGGPLGTGYLTGKQLFRIRQFNVNSGVETGMNSFAYPFPDGRTDNPVGSTSYFQGHSPQWGAGTPAIQNGISATYTLPPEWYFDTGPSNNRKEIRLRVYRAAIIETKPTYGADAASTWPKSRASVETITAQWDKWSPVATGTYNDPEEVPNSTW